MKKPNLHNANAEREPFKVPEGYFDSFTAQMMAKLPEQPKATLRVVPQATGNKPQPAKTSLWRTNAFAAIKPYLYIAAMVGSIYFGVCIYKYYANVEQQPATMIAQNPEEQSPETGNMTEEEAYEYASDACDYIMPNSYDIVACVTSQDY